MSQPSSDSNRGSISNAGVFVGRQREMDELRAALEETIAGRGRLDGETRPCPDCPGPLPDDRFTGTEKSKIGLRRKKDFVVCHVHGTIILRFQQLKGGDPVSREALERGVGTVRGAVA